MGVLLTPIIQREQSSLRALQGKSFAVDGNIELHQFLAIIRRPDGSLFTDSQGRVTSHLLGLLNRTARLLIDYRMKLIFVFDGRPNRLKRRTVEARRAEREKAEKEYAEAVSRRDYTRAWSKAVMTGRVTGEVLDDARRLLSLMGVPWLEALEDAEAQASFMASTGMVWAVGSKDYDCLLYGAPTLVRYLTITGREYLPVQKKVRLLIPERISLEENLERLGITREQLVDVAILVGTDFNEGVMGFGPKRAYSAIKKYGSIGNLPADIKGVPADLEEIRRIFLNPRVRDVPSPKRTMPNTEGLVEFLSGERGFAKERVLKVATGLSKVSQGEDVGLTEWLR